MGCGRARRRCIDLSMGGGGITSVMTFFWLFKKGHCTSMGLNLIPIFTIMVHTMRQDLHQIWTTEIRKPLQNCDFCGFALITTGLRRRKFSCIRRKYTSICGELRSNYKTLPLAEGSYNCFAIKTPKSSLSYLLPENLPGIGQGITSVMTFFWLFKKGHCTSM